MTARVFISYRRDDSRYQARMVYAAFTDVLARDNVFMDIDSIPPGTDFVAILEGWVGQCEILLALIGPGWVGAADPKSGRRRLDNPHDFVRIEICEALKRGIPVVPVLLDNTPMPDPDELPDDLKTLVRRQAEHVQFRTFDDDVHRLIRRLKLGESGPAMIRAPAAATPAMKPPRPVAIEAAQAPEGEHGKPRRWSWVAAGAAALMLAGWFGLYRPEMVWMPWAPPATQDEAKLKAEGEARRQAEEETRRQAAEEAKRKADEEAKRVAEQEARRKADEEARRAADQEARRKADEEARRKAAEEARRDPALAVAPGSGQSFRDRLANGQSCPNCPEMVVVPAGKFRMGSPPGEGEADERPQHDVTIERPFGVGRFEVTFEEWDACVAGNGCTSNRSPSDSGWGRGLRPVINVSWNDAKEYVAWLSRQTGRAYRLLTEAEWEYAARAGSTTAYNKGDSIMRSQAQFGAEQTIEVGRFSPNAWGCRDVHGNVWEWVEDNWHPNYQGAPPDGSVWQGGDASLRVLRGGSWYNYPSLLRSAFRFRVLLGFRSDGVGFRVARSL